MADYHLPLFPGEYYHVLSRAVGSEKLFRSDENRRFFLRRYVKYIQPLADTFAYCLLPNHFHFLIRIKPGDELRQLYTVLKPRSFFDPEAVPEFIMQQFSNFLNSYAKAFNKMYNRKGALFIDYLRRVEVKSENQFRATLFYIHKNPVHHQYVDKIEEWHWSSFKTIVGTETTILMRAEVLDWFDGVKGYMQYHQQAIYPKETMILE